MRMAMNNPALKLYGSTKLVLSLSESLLALFLLSWGMVQLIAGRGVTFSDAFQAFTSSLAPSAIGMIVSLLLRFSGIVVESDLHAASLLQEGHYNDPLYSVLAHDGLITLYTILLFASRLADAARESRITMCVVVLVLWNILLLISALTGIAVFLVA